MHQRSIESPQGPKRGPLLLITLLCVFAPTTAAACAAGPQKWMPAPFGYYDSFEAGEVMVGWTRAVVPYYVDCEPTASAQLSIASATGLAGVHDGRITFKTEHDGVGIQMEYRYIQSIAGSGQPVYSEWQAVGTAAGVVTARAEYMKDNPTASIPIEVDYRFVALRDFSGEPIAMGDIEPLRVADRSFGLSLDQLSVEGVRQYPREEASCEFSARPPATLQLPQTSVSSLRAPGDMGPAADFSFSWSCRAGNQGHSGKGDFRFKSTAAISGNPGQLSTSGDAEGVNMLVTLERKDGSQEPIVFDTWYANRLSPGSGGLPAKGSQSMQVRFIRTAKPLVPGSASSTLTIEAIPY